MAMCHLPYNVCQVCAQPDCSLTKYKRQYPLLELVSTVIVSDNCSSEMVKKIDSFQLSPSLFKISGKWSKVK